jgi:2-dehydro-3-deoxyglucarate aldolase
LDAGAGGVIVPMVETAEQLQSVRAACSWPPSGTRGVGFSRGNLFGKHFDNYSIEAQKPLLIAMIEHVRAVSNLAEILGVDGLDAILVGPYDLSASMGITAQFNRPEFIEIMSRIKLICKSANVASGIHVVAPSAHQLQERLKEGYQFLAYSMDSVFLENSAICPDLKG